MAKIEDSYYFSDDFLNFMNQAASQDPYLPTDQSATADEENISDQIDETDNDQINSDYEDLQSQYSSLQSENESLNQQLEDYRFAQNELIQNDDLLRNTYNQGGNSNILNMVLGDEVGELRTKSSKVNLSDVDMTLKGYVGSLSKKFGDKVLVTSGDDQEHAPNSLHYKGEALDLRYFPEVHDYIKNDPIAQKLGISVLNPNHGTAPHTHIQRREFGGGQQPGGLWNTNRQQWVDSVNNANMNKNFVQRFYGQNNPTIQVPGYPNRSTHLMGWDGNLNVAPQVVMMGDGKLHFLPTEDARDEYAQKTGEFIKFQTPQQAEWYANNGYKLGTGVLNSISNGKPYNNSKYKVQ